MANSILTYNGSVGFGPYTVNFTLGTLRNEYVKCRVNAEVDGLGAPVYRDLNWVTDTLVTITSGTLPVLADTVVFTRTIPTDFLIHDFDEGAVINEINLDESNLQTIMLIHQFLDGRIDTPLATALNMNSNKIINLAPGTNPGDAVNYSQISDFDDQLAIATAAAATATAGAGTATTQAAAAVAAAAAVTSLVAGVTYLYCGTSGGTANALTLTSGQSVTLAAGMKFRFIAGLSCTGPTAVTVDANASKAIKKDIGGGLVDTAVLDFRAGTLYEIEYDGTQFQLLAANMYSQGAAIASAATLNLNAATGDKLTVSGTTTVTAITLAEGAEKTVVFSGALTLTAGASLLLPNASSNITTAANDVAVFRGEASGVVRCVSYVRKNGTALVAATQKAWSVVRQVITATGTYTPTVGMVYCDVEAQGSGGGGGGSNQANAAASGGAAGGYARKVFTAATIGASQSVTINAAGTGGSTAGGNGTAGGSVTFGALLTANGGGLGTGKTTNIGTDPAAGGTATGGDINKQGNGSIGQGTNSGNPCGSNGADSPFGSGGLGGKGTAGANATGYGAGGGGGASTAAAGGNGTPGCVVITEFIYV